MKIPTPEFLTEEEEFALRRLELLREVRGKMSPKWALYLPLAFQLSVAGWFFYDGCVRFEQGPPVQALILICGAVMMATLAVVFCILLPMRQRLDAIAKLLEDEVKRSR